MKYDVVIIGGGLAGCTAAGVLAEAGRKVALFSEGLSLHDASEGPASHKEQSRPPYAALSALAAKGVTVFRGDSIIGAEMSEDGTKVIRAFSRNLGDEPLEAAAYVLATGKFFSRGIISNMEGMFEPVFHADVEFEADHSKWYDTDFFAVQPYERFGVKTDAEGHVLKGGVSVLNLYAAGQVLAGEPMDDGEIETSGRTAANEILKKI
jgi:anaerobic glycerol-3-phosphate dehydrogenase B subunit